MRVQEGSRLRPRDAARAQKLHAKLQSFAQTRRPLPGIEDAPARTALVLQMIDSLRRIEFVSKIRVSAPSPARADPASSAFDPLRAAIFHARSGDFDEACWLVFLFVHFGKHLRTGYQLIRDIYGGLGGKPWTWSRVGKSPAKFRAWLAANESAIRARNGKFGNHRKYESLKGSSPAGTGAVVESYVEWVGPTHKARFDAAAADAKADPRRAFDLLYRSMAVVARFGRTARFDYLTMLGKLKLADIEPGVAYLDGAGAGNATGPLRGARLLFGGSEDAADLKPGTLDGYVVELGAYLGVGMQVMEDSLCNWQKSPTKFRPFRG